MIVQSPESAMPEPFKTYVRQRSQTIAAVLGDVVGETNIQLCPRAITPDERLDLPDLLVYGAVVCQPEDGLKSILYNQRFHKNDALGIATRSVAAARDYATGELAMGNRVRVKDPRESDGQGQATIETVDQLMAIFDCNDAMQTVGLILMPHLATISNRLSVGRICLGGFGNFSYIGHESTTTNQGNQVYGGSLIKMLRKPDNPAEHQDLLQQVERSFGVSPESSFLGRCSLAVFNRLACVVGRVSVDVIEGITDNGTYIRDVIDITPRVGGVTPAEVLAIRALHQEQATVCLASSRLLYEPQKLPSSGVNFIDTESLVINAEVLEISA